jgi:hypothetical protein
MLGGGQPLGESCAFCLRTHRTRSPKQGAKIGLSWGGRVLRTGHASIMDLLVLPQYAHHVKGRRWPAPQRRPHDVAQ